MAYKLLSGGGILRLTDGASIPPNPQNMDYHDYLAWVAKGNTPAPADPPLPSEEPRREAARAVLRTIAGGGPGTLRDLAQALLDMR